MRRRRFLTLAAAFAGAPRMAQAGTQPAIWTGQAMGADVSLTLYGPGDETAAMLSDLPGMLAGFEAQFSLYEPQSVLSRLNRVGAGQAGPEFHALLAQCDAAWRLTDGVFDPTVQPLWRALALGADPAPARRVIGWDRVRHGSLGRVTLGPGQQLTLNGIAQGFATERLAATLRARGFGKALINIGEHQAIGGPFRLGLSDPQHGLFAKTRLRDMAVATSSPGALRLGEHGHILSPEGRAPIWSTVSIEAESATLADALSTAAVFMDLPRLQRLKLEAGLRRITGIDVAGNLRTV
ncbi:FAD:protein FMN transferase [Antarctobacter heliothermus]|uniref:FAD:protein FMN transferase n=1 Tax=Antarctobacter heliothermus TaxID=74033 RepID=A0A239IB62_9RHOB|nr:FAD:protein FMN transferase [Antarctobacter heliothermus]SNS90791.1 thiamine biosynthesis lipoprotein [Antarctobacter heliothermus]